MTSSGDHIDPSELDEEIGEEIRNIIKDIGSLPTLPGIVTRLSSMADNDKSSIDEISKFLSSDQTLSANVLKLVNSPFYGFPGRVSTVSNALILLGVNVVKCLAMSSTIFEMMEKNTIGLWEHSLGCAVAGSVIAGKLQLPEGEEISTACLLHDIGKVVIKLKLKDEYEGLLTTIEEEGLTVSEAEQRLLGTNHSEIGRIVAKSWHLPDKLIEPIAYHHDVERSKDQRTKTAVVHLADILIKGAGFGFSGDELVPEIDRLVWDELSLSEEVLTEIIEEMTVKLIETKNFSLEVTKPEVKI